MNARFTPPSVGKGRAPGRWAPGDDVIAAAEPSGPADQACCCAAKPAVRVTMPPTAARPRPTDLLLCAHHYRASHRSLEAARATVSMLPGTPADVAGWTEVAGVAELTSK
jgi:hypothetical protein